MGLINNLDIWSQFIISCGYMSVWLAHLTTRKWIWTANKAKKGVSVRQTDCHFVWINPIKNQYTKELRFSYRIFTDISTVSLKIWNPLTNLCETNSTYQQFMDDFNKCCHIHLKYSQEIIHKNFRPIIKQGPSSDFNFTHSDFTCYNRTVFQVCSSPWYLQSFLCHDTILTNGISRNRIEYQ